MRLYRLLFACCIMLVWLPTSSADENAEPSPADDTALEQESQAEVLTFDIWEFQLVGNTVLSASQVEKAVYPFLGPDKTVQDVDAAANALQNAYRAYGYPTVLVFVPEQKVNLGIVFLDIIEGSIGRLKVSGSTYFSLNEIKAMIPALARGTVPHLPTVQDQLRAINTSSPDLRVTPIFRPGRLPGTVAVELRVKDDSPFHGSLELNNRYTDGTTETRLIGNLSYSNLWLKNHNASLTLQTSPEDTKEVQVVVASYTIPVSDDDDITGDRLAMYAVNSNSETGVSSTGAVSVVGKGRIFGARYVSPLKSRDSHFHSMVYGYDYKDFDEDVNLTGGGTVVTPIDYSIFSIEYNSTSISESGNTTVTAGIKMAPRALFGNESVEFGTKRFDANPNFAVFSLELNDEMRFLNGMSINTTLAGQLANQPLISNEQYSVGGAATVRGYFESQVLADDAVRGSIEINSPDLPLLTKRGFTDAYAMFFMDAAATKINSPLPGSEARQQLYSAGLGIRIARNKSFTLELDVARPLRSNGNVIEDDTRVHFLIRGAF